MCNWVVNSFRTMLKVYLTFVLIIAFFIAPFSCCLNRIKGFIHFFHLKWRFGELIVFYANKLILKFHWKTCIFIFFGRDAFALFFDLSERASIIVDDATSVIASLSFALRFSKLQLTAKNPIDVRLTSFSFLVSNNRVGLWIENLKIQRIKSIWLFFRILEQSHIFTYLVHMSDIAAGFGPLFHLLGLLGLQGQGVWDAGHLALDVHPGFEISVVMGHQLLLASPSSCSKLLWPHDGLRLWRNDVVGHKSIGMNHQKLRLDLILLEQVIKNVWLYHVLMENLAFGCHISFYFGFLANSEGLVGGVFGP